MQAALPYVDDFLPVDNLNSLESLARHLSRLGPHRGLSIGRRRANREEPVPATGAAALPRREINPALASTFRHPMWGRNPQL
jgi:hypothetical protein